MLKEYVIKKLLDAALNEVHEHVVKAAVKIAPADHIHAAISDHVDYISKWSNALTFGDLLGKKSLTDVFVELDTYVYPRHERLQGDELIEKQQLSQFLKASHTHTVVLGHPGAGKTTSLKQIVKTIVAATSSVALTHFPILIEARALNKESESSLDPLMAHLATLLGIVIELPPRITTDD